MIKTNNVWECPECYKEINIEHVNDNDLELDYGELRRYILKDDKTIKEKIIEYIIYIGHNDITDNENLIEEYCKDLKQRKIPWQHNLFRLIKK